MDKYFLENNNIDDSQDVSIVHENGDNLQGSTDVSESFGSNETYISDSYGFDSYDDYSSIESELDTVFLKDMNEDSFESENDSTDLIVIDRIPGDVPEPPSNNEIVVIPDDQNSDSDLEIIDFTAPGQRASTENIYQAPLLLEESQEIRRSIITPQFLRTITDKIKKLSREMNTPRGDEIIREIIVICSEFTLAEMNYIRESVNSMLVEEGHNNSRISMLLSFIYNIWSIGSFNIIPYISKQYKSVRYRKMLHKVDTTCSICLEDFKPNSMCMSMECAHVFHSRCLRGWLDLVNYCPLCRRAPKEVS